MNNKQLLTTVSVALGALGIGAIIFVLLLSLNPSQRAKAINGVFRVDISDLEPGDTKRISWPAVGAVGPDVVIFRPSAESVEELIALNPEVLGRRLIEAEVPQYYVYRPYSTKLGCRLEPLSNYRSELEMPNGWWDPCHIGAWDMAGRTFSRINGSGHNLANLEIVNFRLKSRTKMELRR